MGRKAIREMRQAMARIQYVGLSPADRRKFDPSQARDQNGMWTDEGGGGDSAGPSTPGAGLASSAAHGTPGAGGASRRDPADQTPAQIAAERARLEAQLAEYTRQAERQLAASGKKKGRGKGKGRGKKGGKGKQHIAGHSNQRLRPTPKTPTKPGHRFTSPRKWEGQNLSGQTGKPTLPHGGNRSTTTVIAYGGHVGANQNTPPTPPKSGGPMGG